MKKWLSKYILYIVLFALFIFLVVYLYANFFFCDENLKKIISDLSLSFITGFILALGVYIVSTRLEESRKEEFRKVVLKEKLYILKNILKNVFQRAKTNWNFSNRTPTFYFDNDWINPLYDLLTQNNREWEVFLQEYKKIIGNNNLVNKLNDFIINMDSSLINAEKLDNNLKFKKLSPELAVSLKSGFPCDRSEAKKNTEFAFWIIRATWAGANSTEIMFGIALFTDNQLLIERIEGLMTEAESLSAKDDFQKFIKEVNNDKKKLNKTIILIRKIINKS